MADQHNPQHGIEEGELLAYLEGTVDPEVADRIARSPDLLSEVGRLRAMDALLHSALHRASCPDLDDLLRYQAGLLTKAEQQRIKRHAAGCEACREELAHLAEPLAAPASPSIAERLTDVGKRILTAFLQPGTPQPALALRGNEQRRYEYHAGDYQVVLALVPPVAGENIWQIEGQLLGYAAEEHDTPVRLLRGGAVVADDRVDEFGFFGFAPLEPGSYTLQIELLSEYIVIEEIAVQ